MANTACRLFALGLLMVLSVNAGNQNEGHGAGRTVPDLLVYIEDGNLVTDSVLLGAEATATRMFGGSGLRV